ncbi:MAG: ferric reductase-like transmembrane domain-containing protein [Candidatus Staskawiczbacteria bacterium]|nr:ferric reductase-like transmembrane domain-containing protein [Candidatus Staskawiczbacteria bacterium]
MKQNKILQKSGWLIVIILSFMPLALWLFELPLQYRFSNSSLLFRSVGDVAGLCGMAMFSLVLILSARLKFFEKFFKGINESYTAHHFFGGLAFCLLLFHPLFLAYNYFRVSFMSAALFFLPGPSLGQNFGIIGLVVMIITLVITFYMKIRYQIWKFTHKFLGLAFVFALLHTFLIGGDIANNQPLKIYLLGLGILAIVAYFYRAIFSSFAVKFFDYTIKNIKSLQDKTCEIELQAVDKEIKFTSGQFGFVKFFNKELTMEAHPFSFSSAPGQPLKIAIKELGDYTNKISSLKAGDRAKIEGPFGSFNFRNYKRKKQVWIAGGIGITPFLSMMRDLTNADDDYQIDLYYSARNANCLVFRGEISEISTRHKNLNVILWASDERGFLNANLIKIDTSDVDERDILICGPSPMMSALKEQFLSQGLKRSQIHSEEFQLY